MKNFYLLLLLTVSPFFVFAQNDDFDEIIERDILGYGNINLEVREKKQVIGAARSSKSAEELPVTVYVITHDDIITHGYVTLCDVLKNVPGIRVAQPAGAELGEGFMQRGMTGNTYSKILINGVDVKPSGSVGMPLSANLPIRQAERIEIVYGPASASYGNDACGGVINIVTKSPDEKGFTSADIMIGSGGKQYLNFNTGIKIGHGKHVAAISFYGSNLNVNEMNLPDGSDAEVYNRWNYFLQHGQEIQIQAVDGNVYNISQEMISESMFEKYNFLFNDMKYYFVNYKGDFLYPEICKRPQKATQLGAEVKYRAFSFSYNLMHRMDYTNHGVSPFTYNYSDPNSLFGEYIHRFVVSSDIQAGIFTSNTSLHLIHYRMDENSYRSVNWDKNNLYFWGASDDLGLEENMEFKISDKFSINGGGSFTYTGVLPKTTDNSTKFDFKSYKMFSEKSDFKYPILGSWGIYPFTYWQAGAYMQADYDFSPVNITAGLRYDYSSQWGASLNPRIAFLWKVTDKFNIRASEGFAYKSPAANQLYYTVSVAMENPQAPNGYVIAYHHIPTVGKLTPEHISATEVGLRYNLSKTNYLELVGYTNRVRDPLFRTVYAMNDISNYIEKYGVWMTTDENSDYIVPGYFSVGITDLMNANNDRKYTRAYINESDAKSKLYSLQLIGVFKDIIKPIHLNISGSYTYAIGEETLTIYNNGEKEVTKINYVRGVPKSLAQISIDFDFWKILHLRADNIYSSKVSRKYYEGIDNKFYWAPSYYDLDLVLSAKFTKKLSAMMKVTNVTNELYGGMDAFEMDVDLNYNPQLLRTFTFGITYDF